jgi:hypothetical protein
VSPPSHTTRTDWPSIPGVDVILPCDLAERSGGLSSRRIAIGGIRIARCDDAV